MAFRLIDVALDATRLPDDIPKPLRVREFEESDGRRRWHLLVFAEDVEPILASLADAEVVVTTVETVLPAIDEEEFARGPSSVRDDQTTRLRWSGEVSYARRTVALTQEPLSTVRLTPTPAASATP